MLLICNGMQRSGSTLQYIIANAIIKKKKMGKAEGYFFAEEFERSQNKFERWGKDKNIHIIKTHDVIPNSIEMTKKKLCQTIYIYRDLTKVAISLKRRFKIENDELLYSINNAVSVFYKLKKNEKVLFQRYEDVVNDKYEAINKIAEFLNIRLKNNEIHNIEKECSVENVTKKLEKVNKSRKLIWKARILEFGRKIEAKKLIKFCGMSEQSLFRLRKVLSQFDENTLLHPNHITSISKDNKFENCHLTVDENNRIKNCHLHWMIENGYSEKN